MLKKIIHIDMDAFFAAVEQRERPELKGKPVAVGYEGKRGVVASASYEARTYGVRSAMPSITAKRKCPQLIFVKSSFALYREISQQIRAIFAEYTDLIEPLSLDEAYLDVTEDKKNIRSATLIAKEICQRIFEETGLTASAGVSSNKFVAKVASDINKPNGIKIISPHEIIPFLEQLPIEKFHGIGKVTAKRMKSRGIHTGLDLKQLTELELVQLYGKMGRFYYRIVRGEDNRAVNPNRIRKSISAENTFSEDISTHEAMFNALQPLAEKVVEYMERNDNYGRTLTIKIKYADFQQATRSKTFSYELKTVQELIVIYKELLTNHIPEGLPIRLLGLGISNLQKEKSHMPRQLEFDFPDWEE